MTTTMQVRKHDVQVKAMEGVVSANAFFTFAVLIGITGTITPSSTIPRNCVAGDDIASNFFVLEIISFGCYLLSSLLAQGMKLAVTFLAADDFCKVSDVENLPLPPDDCEEMSACQAAWQRERRRLVLVLAQRIIWLASLFTVMGTFFLLLSMVDAIQLKFGLLSCHIPLAVVPTFALSALVLGGLICYVWALYYTFKYCLSVPSVKY